MLLALLFVSDATRAHFNLNVNIRVIHVLHESDHVRLLIRLPLAYLLADKFGEDAADGTPRSAPYTRNHVEGKELMHLVDLDEVRNDPQGLARIVADGHRIEVNGTGLTAQSLRVRLHPALEQPPFAARHEAEAALSGPIYPDGIPPGYVGDTIVDVELRYPTDRALTVYKLSSTLLPGIPGQAETANLVIDHAGAEPLTFRVRGLMSTPVEISRSMFKAVSTFIREGIVHILEGLDHVLFVFCLILGATTLSSLAWRITGFTIGHSITLSLGFLGYFPSAEWFVPMVETGIALSIVYAAIVAMRGGDLVATGGITVIIGLLHGLGFSFVLREILKLDSLHLWQSLLAFNVGVEIGQIAIAATVWPLLWFAARKVPRHIGKIRWSLAVPCIAIASFWAGQRAIDWYRIL